MSGLEELRRLEAAATRGPWGPWERGQGVTPHVAKRDWVEVRNHATIGVEMRPADAEFIVAARNQLPRILDALDAVLELADTLEVHTITIHARATAAATHHWQDSGAYQALELGQTQAAHEIRAMIATRPTSRRRCSCGCKQRQTQVGLGDGVALMGGCELSVRRWVRDGYRAVRND